MFARPERGHAQPMPIRAPEVTAGIFVSVAEGTSNADTFWLLTTNDGDYFRHDRACVYAVWGRQWDYPTHWDAQQAGVWESGPRR